MTTTEISPFVDSLDDLPEDCFKCFKVDTWASGVGFTNSLETATIALSNGVSVICMKKHRIRGWE